MSDTVIFHRSGFMEIRTQGTLRPQEEITVQSGLSSLSP
jgi:hypothetical protein